MAEVHRFPEQRREFLADGDRSALRATWHNDSGFVVISLWRGEACVATSHLTPKEAARLATFITGGLAELAHEGLARDTPITWMGQARSPGTRLRSSVRSWRYSIARSLESIARRMR